MVTTLAADSSALLSVDSASFLVVVAAAAVAALTVAVIGPHAALPVVVLELVFGIVIGPDLLDLDQTTFGRFFSCGN